MGCYPIGAECCNNCEHWACHSERQLRGNPPNEVYTASNCDKCQLSGRNMLSENTCGMFRHIGGIARTFKVERDNGQVIGEDFLKACLAFSAQSRGRTRRTTVANSQAKQHGVPDINLDGVAEREFASTMEEQGKANERTSDLVNEGMDINCMFKDKAVEFMNMLDQARLGDAAAQYRFAMSFLNGAHGASDMSQLSQRNKASIPFVWLEKSAEQGFAEAQYRLGCYPERYGVEKSIVWLRKASEQGLEIAALKLDEVVDKVAGTARMLLGECIEMLASHASADAEEQAITKIKEASSSLDDGWTAAKHLFKIDPEFVNNFSRLMASFASAGSAELKNAMGKMYAGWSSYKNLVEVDYPNAVKWFEMAANGGSLDAMDNLGVCYANGDGVDMSDVKAVEWYRRAAQGGLAWGEYHYACKLIEGKGVEIDADAGRDWLQKAAAQGLKKAKDRLETLDNELYGDVKFGPGTPEKDKVECRKIYAEALEGRSGAEYEMGNILSNGMYCILVNKKEAFGWYMKAAEHGSADAQYEVARFYLLGEKDVVDCNDEEKFKWYWEAAAQGHVESMRKVGDSFYYGSGVDEDRERAKIWYARAAKAGDDVSLNMLKGHWELDDDELHRLYGIISEIPVGMNCKADDEDKSKFRELLDSAKSGDAVAQFRLGHAFVYGDDGAKLNEHHGVMWLKKSAAQGNADAENLLGDCYSHGWGVGKNADAAAKHYRSAAEKGHGEAAEEIGKWYRRGIGVEKDMAEAFRFYMIAAKAGSDEAQFWVGKFYAEGWGGVAKDYSKAVEWYEKSATQDNADAICTLGWCYQLGNGVEQDYAKAVEWFKKGVDQDDGTCMNNLARLIEEGKGTERDYEVALELFKKATENDCARANYHVGRFYENGLGCDKDIDKAKEWYKKAADKGDKDAKAALERLNV